jgi:hypothetical protein
LGQFSGASAEEIPEAGKDDPADREPARAARHEPSAREQVEEEHPRHEGDVLDQHERPVPPRERFWREQRARGQHHDVVARPPRHQHQRDQQGHGVAGLAQEDEAADRSEDHHEDRIERHLVEGVHAGGKAEHRQLGAHGLVRRGELRVAGGQRDREQTEFGHGQQHPRGPRDSQPVATPRWVGPCLRLTVYSNLPMRIRPRSVRITRPR